MKSLLLKLATHTATTLALIMLLAGSYEPLIAQADIPTTGDSRLTTPVTTSDVTSPLTNDSTDSRLAPTGSAAANSSTGSFNTTSNTPNGGGGASPSPSGSFPSSNCAITSGGSIWSGGDWAQCITDIVYVFTVGIGTGFAYVAAYFFDWAIALSLNGTAYALNFVSQGWTTARDLANMAFLFILLYIAFKIIFDAETNETVHMLVVVIVVALLVNFSFFFTRLVIDAGNILSIQFYNAIQAPSVASTAAGNGVVQGTVTSAVTNTIGVLGTPGAFNNNGTGFNNSKDLTFSIMGMLNLQGLLGNDSFQAYRSSGGYTFLGALISLSFLYISAGIMLWLLTVAFVTNGVKFLMRIVVLWFLIIASPLAFVARAVPRFHNYYDQWQDALIKHAFYPVAFMFIFLILTNFANQMGGQNSLINGIFNGLQNNGNSTSVIATLGFAVANVGIRMGFVIAMLYVGLKASDEIGTMGSHAAQSVGNWVGTGLLKGYNVPYKRLGPGAWAGGIDKTLKTGTFSGSLFGKELFKVDNKLTRKIGQFGNGIIGYEARRYITKPLADTAVPGSHGESYTGLKERAAKEGAETGANVRDMENREIVKNVAKTIADNIKAGRAADFGMSDEDKKKVQNLNKRELEAISSGQIKQMASLLTEDQIKRVAEMEKVSDKDKEEIRQTWEETSKSASLHKANTAIDDAEKFNSRLTVPVADLHTASRPGATINKAAAENLLEKMEEKLDNAKTNHARASQQLAFAVANPTTVSAATTAAAVTDLTRAETELRNANKAHKKIESLEEFRSKIGAGVGGSSNSGEFIKK